METPQYPVESKQGLPNSSMRFLTGWKASNCGFYGGSTQMIKQLVLQRCFLVSGERLARPTTFPPVKCI